LTSPQKDQIQAVFLHNFLTVTGEGASVLAGETSCDALVRKLSAVHAVLELACQRPELKEELLDKLFQDEQPSRDTSPVRSTKNISNLLNSFGAAQQIAEGKLALQFQSPPGLESVLPMTNSLEAIPCTLQQSLKKVERTKQTPWASTEQPPSAPQMVSS